MEAFSRHLEYLWISQDLAQHNLVCYAHGHMIYVRYFCKCMTRMIFSREISKLNWGSGRLTKSVTEPVIKGSVMDLRSS